MLLKGSDILASEVKCLRVLIERRDLSNERNTFKNKTIFYQENKAKARARYKADPEIVSYPDPHRRFGWITSPLRHYSRNGDVIHPQLRCGSGYETNPKKKKASVRDSYNVDIASKQSAKRQRYQEDVEENRAAKR